MPDLCEPEAQQPHRLDAAERFRLVRALWRMGLWPLRLPGVTHDSPLCQGYANGCMCAHCDAREHPTPAPPAARQPWEAQ
jgi:hypothetical protein